MKKLTLYTLSMLLAGILLNSCKKDVPSIKTTKTDTTTAKVSTIAYGNYQYITVDKSGNIYALRINSPADTIYKFTQAGVRSVFFVPPVTMNDDTAVTHVMNGLTTDSLGNIYTVVYNGIANNPNVFKIASDGTSTVAYSNINFTGELQSGKIAFDGPGNFYYTGNGTLYKISTGGATSQVAASTVFTPDVYGNIYYATNQTEVQKISPSGTVTTVVPQSKITGDIANMGSDVFGNVYISSFIDDSNSGISASQVNTATITKLKTNDSLKTVISTKQGYADGPISTAKIMLPLSLVTDAAGNLYFLDSGDIRKITF